LGVASLRIVREYPVATSAVMWPCKSLRLIAVPQHRFRQFNELGCKSVHAALLRPVQGRRGA